VAYVFGAVKLDPMPFLEYGGDDVGVFEGTWGDDEKGGADIRLAQGVEHPGCP
jgi:hypothetical protein